MAFQKQVAREPAPGFPGSWGSANNYYAAVAIAGEDVAIGRMCRIVSGAETGDALDPDRVFMGGDGAIGISLRSRVGVIPNLMDEYSNAVNQTLPVELVLAGDVEVYLTNADMSAVERGMKVFYRLENSAATGAASNAGELLAGEAGSEETGLQETDWHVYRILDADTGLVKVSTYRKA